MVTIPLLLALLAPQREVEIHDGFVAERLSQLVQMSQVVAVVKVEGVSREAHTPFNSPYAEQHWVFRCRIVESWKATEATGRTLKVWKSGGNLPWKVGVRRGVGFRYAGQPMLVPGKIYLLFLQSPATQNRLLNKAKFVSAQAGEFVGKAAELDEFTIVSPPRGMCEVENWRLVLPVEPDGEVAKSWGFGEAPPTLLGLSLAQARKLVQVSMNEPPIGISNQGSRSR